MTEYIESFKAEEGVSRANFNSRITQMNSALSAAEPRYGTEELTAGSSALADGKMYLMYE